MSDLISREELTKKLEYLCDYLCEYIKRQREFMCDACKLGAVIDTVEEMPSAEPERKPGKWIWDKRTGTYHCSECGHDPLHEDVGEIEEYKYCMNCGAKMKPKGNADWNPKNGGKQ